MLDTCGFKGEYVHAPPPRFAMDERKLVLDQGTGELDLAVVFKSEVGQNGTSVSWSGFVTVQGGQYRLCWCAAGFLCSRLEDFAVQVGSLDVIGPKAMPYLKTCVAGQTCFFDGIEGHLLGTEDSLWIMDTCGVEVQPAVVTYRNRWFTTSAQRHGTREGSGMEGRHGMAEECVY